MRCYCKRPIARLMLALGLSMIATTSFAYEWPLSPEAVRSAYFFGRSSDRGKVAAFLSQYVRVFHPQREGPFVGRIELQTPFQGVVQRSWESPDGYSAQRAQVDYALHAETVEVKVLLHLGAGKSSPSDIYTDDNGRVLDHRENFWHEFQFVVLQGHTIKAKSVVGRAQYGRRGQGLTGASVDLAFDANDFGPGEMEVKITAPGGRSTAARFDLDTLK